MISSRNRFPARVLANTRAKRFGRELVFHHDSVSRWKTNPIVVTVDPAMFVSITDLSSFVSTQWADAIQEEMDRTILYGDGTSKTEREESSRWRM